jgi:hypothetical protein
LSVVAGIVPPGQGAFGTVELQFPDPVVVIVAALHTATEKITENNSKEALLTFAAKGKEYLERDCDFIKAMTDFILKNLKYRNLPIIVERLIVNNQPVPYICYGIRRITKNQKK